MPEINIFSNIISSILGFIVEIPLENGTESIRKRLGNYILIRKIRKRASYLEGKYKDELNLLNKWNRNAFKFWLGMLNDLKNRGLKDVLFFCVDGLVSFKETVSAVYPDAQVQRYVIHMLSLKLPLRRE